MINDQANPAVLCARDNDLMTVKRLIKSDEKISLHSTIQALICVKKSPRNPKQPIFY